MRKSLFYIVVICGIISLFLLEITFGNALVSWQDLADFFSRKLTNGSPSFQIIYHLRFPRAMTAFFVGSSLALAGLLMQTFFRNPLAGPSILGISSGASLGVAVATLITGNSAFVGWGERTTVFFAAFVGALGVLVVIIGISRFIKHTVTLLIVGLMISYLTSAVVSVLQFNASESNVKAFVVWGMGTFANADWQIVGFIAIAFLLSLALVAAIFKDLNVLLLGERYAKSMGVDIHKVKFILILVAGIIVAVSTAFCGPIAFVGLAVPHLARGIFQSGDHRVTVPATLFLGGFLGLAADFLSRMPWTEGGLPLNTVMAMVGAPVVIRYILKNRF